jgi:iron complex outermembrane recepter protein
MRSSGLSAPRHFPEFSVRRSLLLAVSILTAIATPAIAADAPQSDDAHPVQPNDIIVTAPFNRDRAAMLAGTSVLTGEALTRDVRTTIGDSLTKLPGVSSTSFGPNASRPILRGFQGERVRVLKDGIGSVDVSNTSVDHPVVVNPLTAERIEVLRGPSALLYGSAAIGGVVNVLDARIPRRVPDHAVHVDATTTYGSAAEERSGFGQVDIALGGGFVAHVDGSYSKTGNLDTGNFILSAPLRTQAATSADPAIRDLATLRGKLPNSSARTWEAAGGAAYVANGGTVGVSFSHYDNLYGVPIRFSLDPAVEAEQVRIAAKQDRADLRAEINAGGSFIDTIRFRTAFADYRHSEINATGAIGTTFLNKSTESRLEFAQAKRGNWRGAFGAQLAIRDFNVIGAEAFVPKNTTQQFGVFTLQEIDAGMFKAEAGARFELTNLSATANAIIGNPDLRRNFSALSGSLGASYEIARDIRIGLTASHSERAPAAEELFANGPHAGTQAFEIGDPDFVLEKSNGVEASLRGSRAGLNFSFAAYYNWFSNFIYEDQTGAVQDDLPVFQLRQADARYWGLEGEIAATIARLGDWTVRADALGDYTNATITGVGPAPRIPPLRFLGGIEGKSDSVDLRAEIEWTSKQTRLAAFETPTPGFTLVNASASLRPFGKDSKVSLILSANNIFNVEARRHASFLKDYAPLSGRDIRATARFSF